MKFSRVTGRTWKYADPTLPPSPTVWVEDYYHRVEDSIDSPQDPTLSCLELNGDSWDEQPRVWQNFVLHTLPDDQPDWDKCWRIVREALAKWELSMPERNLVCGTPEHMLLWRLAYE